MGTITELDVSKLGRFEHNPTNEYRLRHPHAVGRILQDLARKDYVLVEGVTLKFLMVMMGACRF